VEEHSIRLHTMQAELDAMRPKFNLES